MSIADKDTSVEVNTPTRDAKVVADGEGSDLESSQSGPGIVAETARVLDHAAEVRLCRKFDIRILPFLAVMYLFNALDKGNLGNAQTDGLSDGQYFPFSA